MRFEKSKTVLERYADAGHIASYQATLGSTSQDFGPSDRESPDTTLPGCSSHFRNPLRADFDEQLRAELPQKEGVDVQLFVDSAGPPQAGIEIAVTGSDYSRVRRCVSQGLVDQIQTGGRRGEPENQLERQQRRVDVRGQRVGSQTLRTYCRGGCRAQVRTWVHGVDAASVNLLGETYDLVVRGPSEQVDELSELAEPVHRRAFGHSYAGLDY